MKIYFRSGNYTVEKSGGKFRIGELAPSKKCKHPDHQVGSSYNADFNGLAEAIDACICMASDSLKAGSGAKIVKLG
jgi:hypothetical protein